MRLTSGLLLTSLMTLVLAWALTSCGYNPRTTRAQTDPLIVENPGSNWANPTSTANSTGTTTADTDAICPSVSEVSANIFNTTMKACPTDQGYAIRFKAAPAETVCFFPVSDRRLNNGPTPVVVGDKVCVSGWKNNEYKTFTLPLYAATKLNRLRNVAQTNLNTQSVIVTGLMMVRNATYIHRLPCSFSNYCNQNCQVANEAYQDNVYYVQYCDTRTDHPTAFLAGQTYLANMNFSFTYPAYHYLLKFYANNNIYQYIDFSQLGYTYLTD